MKKFFRVLTLVQLGWSGYQWYKDWQKDKRISTIKKRLK